MKTTENIQNSNLQEIESGFLKELGISGKSLNTLKNYKTDLDCFNTYLKDTKLSRRLEKFSEIDADDYNNWLNRRYSSSNSIRRRVQTLRIFFDYLVKNKIKTDNPIRTINVSPKFLDIPRPTSFIEVKTLWVHIIEEEKKAKNDLTSLIHLRNSILVLLIYGAGLKVSNIVALKDKHLFTDKNPRIMITPKKRDPYTIPLPEITAKIVSKYLHLLKKLKGKYQINFQQLLFNANPYKILSGGLGARGIELIFKDFSEKLKINVTAKSLRQACIFKWLHNNIEESQIKEWLGTAPSYSLKQYRDLSSKHLYNEEFLKELYDHYSGLIS